MLLKYKYFMAIILPKDEERAVGIMQAHGAHGLLVMSGEGSAGPAIGELLGFSDNKKEIITGFVSEIQERELLESLYDGLLKEHGAGVAFTIRIDGFIGLKSMFVGDLQ